MKPDFEYNLFYIYSFLNSDYVNITNNFITYNINFKII